jgi:membrane protein
VNNASRVTLSSIAAAVAGSVLADTVVRLDDMRRRVRPDRARSVLSARRTRHSSCRWRAPRSLAAAAAPTRIPWRGWKDILWRTYEQISADRLMLIAAGVFYAMLAVVPAITALVSMYGLFTKASTISAQLNFLAEVMPATSYALISDQVMRIAGNSDGKLTFAFVLALAIALWSANAGVKAIFDALNVVYDEDEKRGIVALNLVSLTFTAGAIGFRGAVMADTVGAAQD